MYFDSKNKLKTTVGDRYKNRLGQWCSVVEYNNSMEVKVVFDSHPKVSQTFPAGDLRKSSFRNKLDPVNIVGNRFENNSGEFCTVISWENAHSVFIEFDGDEGVLQKVTANNLRKGQFLNPKSFDIKHGARFENKNGDWCTVIEYQDSRTVNIVFDGYEKHIKTLRSDHLREGKFKNNYKPVLFGVGYIGEGKYRPRDNAFMKMVYDTWKNMIARGYSDETKAKQPTYVSVSVCEDWFNFQNFADWMINHEFSGLGYHLDKDLISRGNKLYSKENCTLLPRELNAVLSVKNTLIKGIPTGVHKVGNRYLAKFRLGKEGDKVLGTFKTPEEASAVYVEAKEKYVKYVAEKWHGKIEERAYQALMNWTVYP